MRSSRLVQLVLASLLVPFGVMVAVLVYAPGLLPFLRDTPAATDDHFPVASMRVDLCDSRRPDGNYPACCADLLGAGTGTASLIFAGDTAEVDAVLPLLEREGFDYPFSLTASIIREADVAVANVEAPITDGGERFPLWKEYVYRAPSAAAPALMRAGFDVAVLANNHTLDYGITGLADTMSLLAQSGIVSVGAGPYEEVARRPVIINAGKVRIGILARCERQPDWEHYVRQYARSDRAGVAALEDESLALDIAALRPLVDVIIVSVHWGKTYEAPTQDVLEEARRIGAMGADLVVGHHPHMVHPMMMAGATPVMLSLGNYAFGTPGHPQLAAGALLRVQMDHKHISRLELLPLDTQNQRTNYRPTLLEGEAARAALAPIIAASQEMGAALRLEGDRAVLDLAARRNVP